MKESQVKENSRIKKGKIILVIGVVLLLLPAIIAILIIFGVFQPTIFPETGLPLDPTPLINVLCSFLMLVIIIYVSTRLIDYGIKILRGDFDKTE